MSAKISASRKRAFLAALAATGNQTLAAERAKVSRSWVQLHRTGDSGFRRACEDAVAQARAALRQAQGERVTNGPSARWSFHDGEELVVKGTGGAGGGKRVQIARARLRQWSPRVEKRFLTALSASCNVKAACAEVGLTPASAYNHRRRWPGFAARWREALEIGYDKIECALIHAAGNLLDPEGPVEVGPVREMTAAHAIHLWHMHKHQVRGLGKRPGLRAREPDIEEVRAEILRKIEVLERAKARGLGTG